MISIRFKQWMKLKISLIKILIQSMNKRLKVEFKNLKTLEKEEERRRLWLLSNRILT